MDSYLKSDYFKPDLFTKLVVEALEWEFGSVREFCRQHDFSMVQFSRGLTPRVMNRCQPIWSMQFVTPWASTKAVFSSESMSRWTSPVSKWCLSNIFARCV